MVGLSLPLHARTILCLGAHADDIEIGCGGSVLSLLEERSNLECHWVVLSARGDREREARDSAARLLEGASTRHIVIKDFEDGFFPYVGAEVKRFFEELKRSVSPDLVFTHYRGDRHQDHRLVSELTWNTFRDHFILEYEIPKYDGDLGAPNFFVPLSDGVADRKIELLLGAFPSQARKHWFTQDMFRGLMRVRGIECGASARYAEAFYAHKVAVAW